jgi:cleavage stimulation factor subunit 3
VGNEKTVEKAKPLYMLFHQYEAEYGGLTQITQLEQQMRKYFPDDPKLTIFQSRFVNPAFDFDPTSVHLIVSYGSQMKPKAIIPVPSVVEPVATIESSPGPRHSPKRPLDDEGENEERRKFIRGESPLKGAAGRRLAAARQNIVKTDAPTTNNVAVQSAPKPLPNQINLLLSIMPSAHHYHATRFIPQKMLQVVQSIDLNRADLSGRYREVPATVDQPQPSNLYGGYNFQGENLFSKLRFY